MINDTMLISELAERTRSWLIKIIHKNDNRTPDNLILLILALFLCDAVQNRDHDPDTGKVLNAFISDIENYSEAEIKDCGWIPLLLCHRALTYYNISLPRLSSLAERLAQAFNNDTSKPKDKGMHLLLHRLGLLSSKPEAKIFRWEEIGMDPVDILLLGQSSIDMIYKITDIIDEASLFGTETILSTQEQDALSLSEILIPLMIQRFRKHDIITGATLLRSIYYITERVSNPLQDSLWYLIGQQRLNGPFGYHINESDTMNLLQCTVASLWSIAELQNISFRVYGNSK